MKKILSIMTALALLCGCSHGSKSVKKITTNVSYVFVAVDESYKSLKVTTSPDSDGSLTYTSKDKSIATVSSKGVIKGISQGKTSITITSKDNKDVSSTVKVYSYPLKVSTTNPYKVAWKWTASYRINDFAADKTSKSASAIRDAIIQAGFDYLGAGYSQAARFGPTYDCSSLIYTLYHKAYGINVGTYTGAIQTVLASYKEDFADRKVGDIIFGTDGTANHVGIYLGNNRMLHCADSLGGCSISSIYYGPFSTK